jgi:Tol biopolymer transport system component
MSSKPRLLVLAWVSAALLTANKCSDVGNGQTLGRFTIRISVNASEQQALGTSTQPSVSADGRFVAFQSTAANLTNNDSNTVQDIFVKDRLTGGVERVSINTQFPVLPASQMDCFSPSMSADGRYVVFASAGSFAPASNPPFKQPYIHDRLTNTTRQVTSEVSNSDCLSPAVAVTAAGRVLVAFLSKATTDFITGLQGGPYTFPGGGPFVQVWVADVTNPFALTIRLVSTIGATANASNADCNNLRFSADGSALVFNTVAQLDTVKDTDANSDVYLTSPNGGAPELVSLDINGLKMQSGDFPAPSADGRFVVFTSQGNVDSTLPNYPAVQIIMRDRTGGKTILVSKDQLGNPGTSGSGSPVVSGDGQRIAYMTSAGNLLGTVPPVTQIFVSSPAGPLVAASLDPNGGFATFLCQHPAVSGNGEWVAFDSAAGNLVVGDTNLTNDIFVNGRLP